MGKPPYPHDLLVKGGRARGLQQQLKTHCPKGHPYDEANTRYERRGGRVCRACHRESERRRNRPVGSTSRPVVDSSKTPQKKEVD